MSTFRVPKGMVNVLAYYDSTFISMTMKKEDYEEFTKKVKYIGRKQVEAIMEMEQYGSKEKVVDRLIEELKSMKSKVNTEKTLRECWGEDYVNRKMDWFYNVSSLLHLKRIKNDDSNGWQLLEHKSVTNMLDDGNEYMMWGNTVESLEKALAKVIATMTA